MMVSERRPALSPRHLELTHDATRSGTPFWSQVYAQAVSKAASISAGIKSRPLLPPGATMSRTVRGK